MTGTVTDPTGAVVPDAKVSMRNTATNAVYETRTNPAGQYTMPNLPVGGYEVTFEAAAFKKLVRSGLTLGVTEVLRIDATLEVGSLTESVQITAEAPRLTSDSPMTGSSLTNRDLIELPLTWGPKGAWRNSSYIRSCLALPAIPGPPTSTAPQRFRRRPCWMVSP